VSQSRSRAALRCCIHIFPVVPSLALAYLSLHGYYIGGELSGPPGEDSARFGGLQFAAKMHELAINASIATMVHSYIRRELALGVGLPLGALVAGQRFTELSYLWSTELWAALFSQPPGYSWRRKTILVVIVVTAIFLAATAAPSSAIAIIPRLDMWPCCGTSFWINASSETLWPTSLNASHAGGDSCLVLGATANTSCPSGGFPIIKSYGPFFIDRSQTNVPPEMTMMYGERRVRAMNSTWQIGRNPSTHSTATSPMSVIVDALGLADWGLVVARYSFYRPNGDHSKTRCWSQRAFLTQVEALQPTTRVKCTPITERTIFDSSDVTFLDQYGNASVVPGWGENKIWEDTNALDQGSANFPRLYFMELPPDPFVNSTMGAIVVLPTSGDTTTIPYMACNIDSRWAPGTIFSCGPGVYCGTPDGLNVYDLGVTLTVWKWQSIESNLDWASALNPPVAYADHNVTSFAAIADSAGINTEQSSFYPPIVEGILATMFTDALARLGSGATLQGTLKDAGSDAGINMPTDGQWVDEWMSNGNAFSINSTQSKHWAPMRMRALVNGYASGPDGVTIKLAITILMIHATLALAHTLYEVLFSGLSSSSRDSVSELVALAMNSSPKKALQNTCAGIRRMATMKSPVRIVATEDDHLELDFESPVEADALAGNVRKRNFMRFETNKAYGSLASASGAESGGETIMLESRLELRRRCAADYLR
jgi:hypothetical protein